MECWTFKQCGRVPGGEKEKELGVCPAYTRRAGQACWLIAGTFCGGKVQGTFAQKEKSCILCEFYAKFDAGQRARARQQFHKAVPA